MKKLLIIALLFWGCAVQNPNYVSPTEELKKKQETLKMKMMGLHYSLVIQAMGAYTREAEDGSGGKILIWTVYTPPKTQTNFYPMDKIGEFGTYETHTPASNYETQVFVNKNGEIYNVIFKNP